MTHLGAVVKNGVHVQHWLAKMMSTRAKGCHVVDALADVKPLEVDVHVQC